MTGDLSRFSRTCLHLEFEAALILLQKSKINRGDSHEKLLRRHEGDPSILTARSILPVREYLLGYGATCDKVGSSNASSRGADLQRCYLQGADGFARKRI